MKVYCFDIDNTICRTEGTDYENSTHILDRIKKINELKLQGNKIIFFTARGFVTGKDLYEFTYNQLKSWEVNFDELYLGKPAADFYIDDKSNDLFGWFENEQQYF